ncbi:MAG: serine/threonine protein kinase [Phormidesmis sp.]
MTVQLTKEIFEGENIDQSLRKILRDRYQLKRILGKHAGRRTYLAKDNKTGKPVILKLMLFGPDFTWQSLKLFQREAQTLAQLNHPAIPKYLNFFDIETPTLKGFALVQTYIKAHSLQSLVTSGRRFNEQSLKRIAQSVLTTLHHLHTLDPSIIHRDIKPSNILLAAPSPNSTAQTSGLGKLSLIDFGSVQTLQHDGTLTIVGTYGYMAPEQFGGRAKPASDLYGLGATLIYLATGEHPVTLMQNGLQINFNAALSPAFVQWLQQLTHVDLSKRTASAAAALHQLTLPKKISPHRLAGPGAIASESSIGHQLISRVKRKQQSQQRTYADFSLFYIPPAPATTEPSPNALGCEELEIEFWQRRLRGKSLFSVAFRLLSRQADKVITHHKEDPQWMTYWKKGKNRILTVIRLTIMAIVLGFFIWQLMQGAILSKLMLLALYPLLFIFGLLTLSVSPLRLWIKANPQTASIRLMRTPENTFQLHLTAPIQAFQSKPPSQLTPAELNPIHISAAPLKEVTIRRRNWPLLSQATFTLYLTQHQGIYHIKVLCTPKEARWLTTHLSNWGITLTQ